MTSPVLVVLHRKESCPGRIGRQLRAQGHALQLCRPACGEALPASLPHYAGVIVFGGPMSANDETLHIRREIDWIGDVLRAGVPFLGVCLGAQMLAKQLGGHVGPHPLGEAEIGFHPILPTEAGLGVLPRPLRVYQWHREGFTLPRDAVLLARGAMFENQLFRYGERAFGLQFHPEVTFDIMCRLHREARCAVLGRNGRGMAQQHLMKLVHGPRLARWLEGFLSRWLTGESEAEAAPVFSPAGERAPA